MLTITKDNVIEYIQDNTGIFNSESLFVEDISDFNPDGQQEGYVNYLFRVYSNEKSVILKQARPYLKVLGEDFTLDPLRNQIEYQTMKLRSAFIPQHVPEVLYFDEINNIFIMEDLAGLEVMRFELNKMRYFPNFAQQIAEFMAKSNFYTSELFLDPKTHRQLQAAFINPDMRAVMENAAFVREGLVDIDSNTPKQALLNLSNRVWSADEVVLECYKMRDVFMKRGECLIHGDLHTSNIFIDSRRMKVFDMEYTFMGPYSFDAGYLIANFISQFSAYTFRTAIPEQEREKYFRYLLDTIRDIYNWYMYYFKECWQSHVKEDYREIEGYQEAVLEPFLSEVIGFAACANLIRLISMVGYPDYDVIEDEEARLKAQGLSIAIDQYLLFNRARIKSIDELISTMNDVRKGYAEKMA